VIALTALVSAVGIAFMRLLKRFRRSKFRLAPVPDESELRQTEWPPDEREFRRRQWSQNDPGFSVMDRIGWGGGDPRGWMKC
jgi:hypothetical protein